MLFEKFLGYCCTVCVTYFILTAIFTWQSLYCYESNFWTCSKRYHLCDNFMCPKWNEVSYCRAVFLLEWMSLFQDILIWQLCQQIVLSLRGVKIANTNDDTVSTNVCCYPLVCISKIVFWIPVFVIPYQLPNGMFCIFLACWKIIILKYWFFSSWTN